MKPLLAINQISIVVEDIEKTVKTYADDYNVGPWSIFKFGTNKISDMKIGGKKENYKTLNAYATIDNLEIELIQPLDKKSGFAAFLKEHGDEGLYSVAWSTENYDDALEFFKKRRIAEIQSGNWLDRYRFTYLETIEDLGHIVKISEEKKIFIGREINQWGNSYIVKPTPDKVYPSKDKWASMKKPFIAKILQVNFVVKDLDKTVKNYADIYGIGPWPLWDYNSSFVNDMKINGIRKDFKIYLTLLDIGNTQVELIEPRDDQTAYYHFLKKYGDGFQHLGCKIADFDEAVKLFEEKKFKEYMSGSRCGTHYFAYMRAEKDLKFLIEIFKTKPGAGKLVDVVKPNKWYPS